MIRKQSLLIWWQIIGSEEPTAEQNNSQQCAWLIQLHQTKLRALMMPLCHCVGLFGSTDPSRGSPSTSAHPPRVWGYGSPLCFSNLFARLLSSLTQWASLAEDTGKHLSAMLCSPQQRHGNMLRSRQLRAGERLFFPWVMGVAGR